MYHTVFISDLHLGTKKSKAKTFLKFLDEVEFEQIVLVGDIIDGWALRRGQKWTKTHTEVLRKLLKISETHQITYIVGNHDDFIRPFLKNPFNFGNVEFYDQYIYESVSGRKIFITHGDKYDFWMKIPSAPINFLAHFTDFFYRDKPENQSVHRYIRTCSTERRLRRKGEQWDGVICGHTHRPKFDEVYMNCGNWVKDCTFLAEDYEGNFSLQTFDS